MHTAVRVFTRRPARIVGIVLLLFFIVLAVFGHVIYPHPSYPDASDIYAAPSWKHILGTDYAGRDIWIEIVQGAQGVLSVAALAAVFTIVIGAVIGLAAGYLGTLVDTILMRLTDLFITIPSFALLLILAVTIGVSNVVIMALLLSLTSWGGLARSIRAMVLTIRERSFIEVSRGMGIGKWRVLFRDILPNLIPYLVINLMLSLTNAVYGSVGLFFLGVVPFKANNWGVMLSFAQGASGAMYSTQSLMFLLSPILAIVLLQTGIILTADAINEIVDPRLRAA
ncbi:MAG: ABC transporter permease [Alicyclobacillus sp.]|nr:ABC transporter permease [Alicyclobacillus sp.]